MKIHILDPIHDMPLSFAEKNGEVVKWDDKDKELKDAEAILVRTSVISKEMMKSCPNLKVIAKHGIGTDNIDIKAAKELGITVTNTPTANVESVAELAVSLILSSARYVPYSYDLIRKGLDKVAPKELTGLELGGKNLGMVGLGRIGQNISKILKNGFNMNVLGFDPFLSQEKAEELGVQKYDDLLEMLRNADVISVAVPLMPSTVNLIDKEELNSMKNSAILVNTSRGKIVNEQALYDALKEGQIRCAALDVFEIEPPVKDNPLLSLNNFIGTPHIGAATEEALIRMGQTAVEEILRVRDGLKPLHEVK